MKGNLFAASFHEAAFMSKVKFIFQKAVQQVSLNQLCSKFLMNGDFPNDLEREPSYKTVPVRPVVSGHIVPLQRL